MEKIEITIGFKYSRLKSGNMSYENYWESFEVVGVLYSDGYEGGRSEWKTKQDVLNSLEKQVQIISLSDKFQQRIFNKSIKDLEKDFEDAYKMLPEFREIRVD